MADPYIVIYEYAGSPVPHANMGFFDNTGTQVGIYGGNFHNLDSNPLTLEGGIFDETTTSGSPTYTSAPIVLSQSDWNTVLNYTQNRVQDTLDGDDFYFVIGQNCVDFIGQALEEAGVANGPEDYLHGIMDVYAEGMEFLRGMANDFGDFWMQSQGDTGSEWHDFFSNLLDTFGDLLGTMWGWLFDQEQQEMVDYSSESPLTIDLNGDGIQTISVDDSNVLFDVNGDGTATHTGWISSTDGLLALDTSSDGIINDGLELFGGQHSGDAFGKLAAFDNNLDGQINAADDVYNDLLVWVDANSDGVTNQGELQSLSYHGIDALMLSFDNEIVENNGNFIVDHSIALVGVNEVEFSDVFFWQA